MPAHTRLPLLPEPCIKLYSAISKNLITAPTLVVGRALAAASALAAVPGIGAAAAGFEAASGFDSSSVRWFQPVANAAGAGAVRRAPDAAGGSTPRAPDPSAGLAGGENGVGGAAPPPPPRHRLPSPPGREDSDDDDTYVRMDFARTDKKFDSPQRGWSF